MVQGFITRKEIPELPARSPGDSESSGDGGDAGSSELSGTGSGQSDGGTPQTTWRAAYHVVDIAPHGSARSSVLDMSRNGIVLSAGDGAVKP